MVGGALSRNTYEEYGAFGPSNGGRFSFTGQIVIPELALLHYKARTYNAALGRFLQTDPVGYEDQLNLYAYVANDPLNNTDPTGQILDTIADIIFIVADAGILIYDEVTNGGGNRGENLAALGADAVGVAVPFATGAGLAVRGARGANRAADAARATCCFVAGTLVETREGLRPIEEIEVGDLVLSRNEATGETAFKPVTELVRRHERQVWRLTFAVAGANGSSSEATFGTTDDHPWRTTDRRWVRTDELQVGMEILRADGAPARVTGIVRTDEVTSTYNLEVADWHTYFVGEARVWVHNACPNPHGPRGAPDHRADVEGPGRDQADAQARPGETVLTERPVQGHPGVNRRADNQVVGTDGRTRVVVESERRPNGAYHRERVQELEACGIECQTRPLPPRKP